MKDDSLSKLRAEIDQLDNQLLEILNARARIAVRIAKSKGAAGTDAPFYRAERESVLLTRIQQANQGPLSDKEVARLFREVMSACLALEKVMPVGFLGPQGTFTHEAALKHFGNSVETKSFASIPEVFRQVEINNLDYGVVPVENSTEGVVNHTLDQFVESEVRIVGEVQLKIHHNLIGSQDDLSEADTIYSHQQSFAQCSRWLAEHLPNCRRIDVGSTAEAARKVKDDKHSVAIASLSAVKLYDLNVLYQNIEDEPNNTTRFLIIGNHPVSLSGNDKTSLLVSVHNQPGALAKLLQPFGEYQISMSKIESRPTRKANWEYVFFIDVEGHGEEEPLRECLRKLEDEASLFKLLGSYPRSVL